MIKKIFSSTLNGEISAITSKSFAHRAMICHYLATGQVDTLKATESGDVLATKRCLSALKNGELLDAGESGSTLRFFIPLVLAIGGKFTFVGHGKLMQRPNDELFLALSNHGVSFVKKENTLTVTGKLTAGEFSIRGDVSSQYITGLMFALPLLDGDSVINLTTNIASRPYVDITLEVLKKYGIEIIENENKFIIKGNQKFKPAMTDVEGDWSNSAFFLVGGAISGEVTVSGLNVSSLQGDKVIVDILKSAGAHLKIDNDKVTAKKSELKAFTFNANDCPDLVPIASILAGASKGQSVITNVQRLKIKESNRVESTINMLSAFGVTAYEKDNNLFINGANGQFSGGTVSSFNDHRIAMSTAIGALIAKNTVIIEGADAVNKSYPDFYKDYSLLGGKVSD